ncbi:helix-turn-helix transcriptional regulator [Streptomyces griseorubiginosus]|uniref:helix-turn-helix transcriptional regulator n=1 Tax=Streptomyces griseorubiginosus TaxID=67304 RepID=UPI001AD6ED5F|nr:LuxR C-terminal-related transcriptional regulator [Streptomyces griseorubiginosus]MBO4257216.1 LuxR family transcriptional regulator [Streptomyces griseorubiginosus]
MVGDWALELATAAADEILPRLSAVVRDEIPHRWAAVLVAGRISVTPHDGDHQPSTAELAALEAAAVPGQPWHRPVTLGGTTRPALVAATAGPRAPGSLLVLADAAEAQHAYPVVQRRWEVAAALLSRFESLPTSAAERFFAGEHAKQLLLARDTHAATLRALLAALRSRELDDSRARQAATDMASTALTALQAASSAQECTVQRAFSLLTEQLRPLVLHTEVELETVPPATADRLLPAPVGQAATAVARGCVLVMLEHTHPRRIRVAWQVNDGQLSVDVRDDGDCSQFPLNQAEYRLRERLTPLGGDYSVETVPGWGTTITARFPLALPPSTDVELLRELSPRELTVMAELVRGLTNHQIAERLHVTEHTVKFHVRQILSKLGVRTRGEAAALGRAARL